MRKILAMKFQLESNEGKIVELIAWLQRDGNGKYLCPTHPSRTLLEVTAGDLLTYKRSEHLVIKRLKPWRTSECKDDTEYSEVETGAAWEAGLISR
jgi:hypothetical protein